MMLNHSCDQTWPQKTKRAERKAMGRKKLQALEQEQKQEGLFLARNLMMRSKRMKSTRLVAAYRLQHEPAFKHNRKR